VSNKLIVHVQHGPVAKHLVTNQKISRSPCSRNWKSDCISWLVSVCVLLLYVLLSGNQLFSARLCPGASRLWCRYVRQASRCSCTSGLFLHSVW